MRRPLTYHGELYEVDTRLHAFLDQVKYNDATAVVHVGHSHYLRELLKANLHPAFVDSQPELAAKLKAIEEQASGVGTSDLTLSLACNVLLLLLLQVVVAVEVGE